MNIKETKVTIFEVEDKGSYVRADISEGRKDKDGNWTNMYWKAFFLGSCKERAKELKAKDRINLTSALVENSYDKENKKSFTRVKVFDFE